MRFLYTSECINSTKMELRFPFPSMESNFHTLDDLSRYCRKELCKGRNEFENSNALIDTLIYLNASLESFNILTHFKNNQAIIIISFIFEEDCKNFEKNGLTTVRSKPHNIW